MISARERVVVVAREAAQEHAVHRPRLHGVVADAQRLDRGGGMPTRVNIPRKRLGEALELIRGALRERELA